MELILVKTTKHDTDIMNYDMASVKNTAHHSHSSFVGLGAMFCTLVFLAMCCQ